MRLDVPLVSTFLVASSAAVPRARPAQRDTGAGSGDFYSQIEAELSSIWDEIVSFETGVTLPANPFTGAVESLASSLSAKASTAPALTSSSTNKPATSSASPARSSTSSVVVSTTSTSSLSSSALTTSSATSTLVSSSSSSATSSSTSSSASASSSAHAANMASCASICSSLNFAADSAYHSVTPYTCTPISAGSTLTVTGGQQTTTCGTSEVPSVDICRVTLGIQTVVNSGETYMEVWLPNNNASSWNGRTMSTDNTGVNGCVAYDDMAYVLSMGFAVFGDNGGHNGSSFDGSWMYENQQAILDWASRSRHASVVAGKQVVDQFYARQPEYSYYIGCSAGGAQGMKSAQDHPEDFDGIIAGSAAADFNHLQDWSSRFVILTGNNASDPKFLTQAQWITVQGMIFEQCDEALDGVADQILEDPTLCQPDFSGLNCATNSSSMCLTSTQLNTVANVFTELYDTAGNMLYPALLYGSQVDAFRLGQLSGTVQGIANGWFQGGIWNNTNWNAMTANQTDYQRADELDEFHGYVSSYNGDLSAFHNAGGKMIMYHGLADPLVSGANSQRYYLKVANEMGYSNNEMDDFMRLFRISGMAHCGVGGISGAGAWMFGQSKPSSAASNNIIHNLMDWVEKHDAPETMPGTKFWWDTPSLGVEIQRNHCRFPYRTTYVSGDASQASSWTCSLIPNWQECGPGAHPRLCNVDGSFGSEWEPTY